MSNNRNAGARPRTGLVWSLGAVLALGAAGAAGAEPLILDDVPAPQAAARLADRYGVEVTLDPSLRHGRATVTVEDAGAPGARLWAVNALANALGAEYVKTYIVTHARDGAAVPPKVDVAAPLPPGAFSGREALARVAAADGALLEVDGDVEGAVTVPGAGPLAWEAAEVARQTGTRWRTVYVLTPRGRAQAGRVIGRTGGGSPIVEFARVEYRDVRQDALRREAQAAEEQREEQQQVALAQQQMAAQQESGAGGSAAGGYGSMGYGGYPSGSGYFGGAYAGAGGYGAMGGYGPYQYGASPYQGGYGGYGPSANGGYGAYGSYGNDGYGGTYSPVNGVILNGFNGGSGAGGPLIIGGG